MIDNVEFMPVGDIRVAFDGQFHKMTMCGRGLSLPSYCTHWLEVHAASWAIEDGRTEQQCLDGIGVAAMQLAKDDSHDGLVPQDLDKRAKAGDMAAAVVRYLHVQLRTVAEQKGIMPGTTLDMRPGMGERGSN